VGDARDNVSSIAKLRFAVHAKASSARVSQPLDTAPLKPLKTRDLPVSRQLAVLAPQPSPLVVSL